MENQNMPNVGVIDSKRKEPTAFTKFLNKYFHHVDKGSTTGREISVGILVGIISVCGIFLNMQMFEQIFATGTAAENGEMVASYYFIALLISFVGTLLIGLITRLPLVQTQSLGLGTILISLLGTSTLDASGKPALTYWNLLAISFVSSLLFAIIVSVPAIKKFLAKGVNETIKKGMRAALGILLALVALQLSGLVVFNSSYLPIFGIGQTAKFAQGTVLSASFVSFPLFNYSNDPSHPTLLIVAIIGVLLVASIFIMKRMKVKHPYWIGFGVATILFIVLFLLIKCINWQQNEIDPNSLWGRIWMIASEDSELTHLANVFSSKGMGIGRVFTEGFNFSSFTNAGGNVFLLFLVGILSMLFNSLAFNDSIARATIGNESKKDMKKADLISMGINVASPVFSSSPTSYGVESLLAKEEGAVSGLSSVAASLVMFLSMFVWIIPAIFATYTSPNAQMNLYGHYGETLYILTECSFSFADIIMALVGFALFFKNLDIDYKKSEEVIPFGVTIILSFLTGNLALGAGIGILSYVFLFAFRKPEGGKKRIEMMKEINASSYLLGILGASVFILQLCL